MYGVAAESGASFRGEARKQRPEEVQSVLLEADDTANEVQVVIRSGLSDRPTRISIEGIDAGTLSGSAEGGR